MNLAGTKTSRATAWRSPELDLGSDRRTSSRRSVAVPLKLRIKRDGLIAGSSSVLACTLDLSSGGARLMTSETGLRVGQTVLLQRGQERAGEAGESSWSGACHDRPPRRGCSSS